MKTHTIDIPGGDNLTVHYIIEHEEQSRDYPGYGPHAVISKITIDRAFNIYDNAALREKPSALHQEIDITDILIETADDWIVNLEAELVELYEDNR